MAFMPPQGPFGPQQPPTAPPPQITPVQPLTSTFAVDPGAMRGCMYRNTYIWPQYGPGFWFFPIFVGRTSVAGFRWTGSSWIYAGYDLGRITSFTCY
ncbi:hypothetical protein [Paenibacillus sp. JCM 10914]|uniref:hypothetical protein n=1 Tax=Paenibacillus sp. JCM 10914 TaxID=1236974 RepID=UPI00055C6140|nr:hypothetical protein [Paenibacillus sp. JCM 10914]